MTKADVELPKEVGLGGSGAPETSMIVNVLADGSIVVDRETITLERLVRIIEAESQRLGDADRLDLVLRADRSISTERLNEIARTLMERGVRTWRLATDPSGGER